MRTPFRSPEAPARAAATTSGTLASTEVESFGSWPAITACSSAVSSTVRAHGPPWSSDDAHAISPYRDTVPYVGFTPTVAVNAAGCRIDPPVSDPMASGAWNAARAAALPPPDPPGTRSTFHGLRVGPYAEFSVDEPIANSSMFVLPRIGMPAARSRAVTVASYGDVHPSRIFEPQVVGMSVVVKTSLSASGTPASGDGSASPAATAASTSAAAASAFSAATCRNARYWPSVSAIRSRHALVTSTDDSSLAAILAPSVAASSLVTSSSVFMP